MSTSTIDYDALAAQHGGSPAVDYDALAAQHGGTSVSAPSGDSRNAVQRTVDSLTNVTPEQEAKTKAIPYVGSALNQAQLFGAGAIQGATQPFVHPLDTLSGIGHMLTTNPVTTGKQMIQSAVDNPAGFAGNLVGGAVMGEATAPLAGMVAKGANSAVKAAGVPERLYESALKPGTTIPLAEREAMVKTGLQQGLPVSKGGMDKLGDLVNDLNNKIKAQIAQDPSRPVNTVPALRNLDSVRGKFANQVTPQPDMAEIAQVESNFLNNPKVQPQGAGPSPGSLPASEAQAMKSGTYQALGSKAYGEVKGAAIESQKALARGLKEEIANQFPEINDLNARESQLLDLGPVLERAVSRAGNHQLISLGTPIAATSGGVLFGSAKLGAAIGAMKMVLDNPMVKSHLAIALSKGANIPFSQALARVGAYQSSLAAAASQIPASTEDSSSDQAK